MSIPGLYMSHVEFVTPHDFTAPSLDIQDAMAAWGNYRLAEADEYDYVYTLVTQALMRPWSFPADSAVPALVRAGACTDALSLCHPGTSWDDVRRVCKVRDDWREWLVGRGLGGKLRLLSPDQRAYLHAARMQRLYAREADAAYDRGAFGFGDDARELATAYRDACRRLRRFVGSVDRD